MRTSYHTDAVEVNLSGMFVLDLDIGDLTRLGSDLVPAARQALARAAAELAAQSHAHVVERVQAKLHSTREKYLQHLHFYQDSPDVWVVELEPGAFFVEDGIEAGHEMVDDLLNDGPKPERGGSGKSKTRTAKDGSRYRIIPFQHNVGPSRATPAQRDLTETIKAEMKRQGAPWGKPEVGVDGKPKVGLVRAFDLAAPLKTHQGAGQGWGPIGAPRQGPTGIPFLQGVRVYQRPVPGSGGSKVGKAVMTFRVVSSKHRGTGRWVHPGLEPRKFMDDAFSWALAQWEEKVKPRVLEEIVRAV